MSGDLLCTGTVEARHFSYCVEGVLAGEAQLHDDGGVWGVEIYPRYQGEGHGRTLMLQLLERARLAGHTYVWLYVHASNHAARRLYKRLGFEIGADTQRGLLLRRDL